MTNPNDPAFIQRPGNDGNILPALTKREYFAAMAMSGISYLMRPVPGHPRSKDHLEFQKELMEGCVEMADALIAELSK